MNAGSHDFIHIHLSFLNTASAVEGADFIFRLPETALRKEHAGTELAQKI